MAKMTFFAKILTPFGKSVLEHLGAFSYCSGSPHLVVVVPKCSSIFHGIPRGRSSQATQGSLAAGKQWQRLTPKQLTSHIIMSNTVVARWLRRRMGVYRLIR